MSDALVIRDVSKRYGSFTAVNALNLNVPAGQVVGLLGPNGAGKTTTLRMIMSILYPDTGSIEVLGRSRAIDVKDRIGYLPEERGLYRKMTVEQTLLYFGRLKGLHGRLLRQRIDQALERIGLQDWKKKRVEALSKGMSQKLQFISTILHQPDLVILDEPFSGLDPLNTELLQDLMLELHQAGKTVILSTHQMESAERLCDRLTLINRGRKLIDGTLSEVRAQFASRIAHLEGEGDFRPLARAQGVVDAQVTGATARLELGDTTDANDILRTALGLGRVTRFEIQRPSLHEIFVKLVRADSGEELAASPSGAARANGQESLR